MIDRRFWSVAGCIFLVVVVMDYFPVLTGKVPFPRDIVLRHSAWDGQPRTGPPQQVGQLIDIVAMFYPFRAFAAHSIRSGDIPLWNPHIMSGAPFQANAQSAVFAPLNLLYYGLPLNAAWALNLVTRMVLAAVFTALFARAIGTSPSGAIVSGIAFALGGFIVQWQGESNGESGIWLPLICYSVVRLYQSRGARSLAIAAFAFAAPVLSGHPETAVHSTAVGCALALMLLVTRADVESVHHGRFYGSSRAGSFVLQFVLCGVLALGLAAIQLLPTLEWMGQLGLKVDVVQPVLDRHQGQGLFSRDILRDPSSAGIAIPEGSAYVGMFALLAAPLAWFYRPRRYVWFLIVIGAISAMVAYGIPPVRWIVEILPVVKAMKNSRLIAVVDLAIAALAGFGVTVLEQQLSLLRTKVRVRALALFGASFLVLSFCVYEVHRATLIPVDFWRSPWGSLIFLAAAFVVLASRLSGRLSQMLFRSLTCGLVALEMVTFSYGFLGFTPAAEIFPPAPVLDFIKARAENGTPFRVAKDRVPIPHDAGMIYGFESADGYDLVTEKTRTFTSDFTEKREDGVMFLAENILARRDRRFDMLNVKYLMVTTPSPQFDAVAAQSERFQPVFARGSVAVFENRMSLPRAWLVPLSGIEVTSEAKAQLARVKETSFDPERSVVFGENPARNPMASQPPAIGGRLNVLDRGVNDVHLRAEVDAPSVIVLSQMYYPGWRATVDGSDVPVYPVNYALTGIVVPANAHDIHFTFRPFSFRIGAGISLVSLLVLAYALTRRSTEAAIFMV